MHIRVVRYNDFVKDAVIELVCEGDPGRDAADWVADCVRTEVVAMRVAKHPATLHVVIPLIR